MVCHFGTGEGGENHSMLTTKKLDNITGWIHGHRVFS